MTKFLDKKFSVAAVDSEQYRDNWQATFGKKWGVWIMEADGSNGRWLEDRDQGGNDPWFGSQEEAQFLAEERARIHYTLRYAVLEKP